jgi:hypothetical protein
LLGAHRHRMSGSGADVASRAAESKAVANAQSQT